MAARDALRNIIRRFTPASPPAAGPPSAAEPLQIAFMPVPMADEIKGGRSLHDGYQRGCGLAHSNMPAAIEADPLYRAAVEASGGWSIMVGMKRMDLFLILTRFLGKLDNQNVIEFGSYRGGNALFMAWILRELHPQAKVYACDTYAGMPATDLTRDAHYAGDFADTSQADLEARRDRVGLTNLIVVPGRFEDNLPGDRRLRRDLRPGPHRLRHLLGREIRPGRGLAAHDQGRLPRLRRRRRPHLHRRHRSGRGADHGPPASTPSRSGPTGCSARGSSGRRALVLHSGAGLRLRTSISLAI